MDVPPTIALDGGAGLSTLLGSLSLGALLQAEFMLDVLLARRIVPSAESGEAMRPKRAGTPK